LGYSAGSTLTTGPNNIIIGYNAQPSSANVSNEVTLGNSNNNSYRMYAASWTNASDARYKHDIEDLELGLDFIMKLKPRRYIYNNSTDNKITMGFVAQEVQSVMNLFGMDNYNLVQLFEKDYLGLNTTEIIPILVKAVQELKQENEELKKANEKYTSEIETLRSEIENIKKHLVNVGALGSAK
jgi:FtsZ-binding cell division protein ZapB